MSVKQVPYLLRASMFLTCKMGIRPILIPSHIINVKHIVAENIGVVITTSPVSTTVSITLFHY